jgi:predicted nucleic acid-binding Zn ribbon protein
VGVDVARHTRPGTVRNKELTVFVRGAIWYAQLKRVGTAVLQEKIVRRLGAQSVNRVILRPDPEGGTPA